MKQRNKKHRHAALRELIRTQEIEDQTSLVDILKNRYDIDTNQSIISRDLRDLGVTKVVHGKKRIYELPQKDASQDLLDLAVHDVVHNENMIIVHTMPGLAPFVGDVLDMLEDEKILGTIAGENTVLVIPSSIRNLKDTFYEVCKSLHFKRSVHDE